MLDATSWEHAGNTSDTYNSSRWPRCAIPPAGTRSPRRHHTPAQVGEGAGAARQPHARGPGEDELVGERVTVDVDLDELASLVATVDPGAAEQGRVAEVAADQRADELVAGGVVADVGLDA